MKQERNNKAIRHKSHKQEISKTKEIQKEANKRQKDTNRKAIKHKRHTEKQ